MGNTGQSDEFRAMGPAWSWRGCGRGSGGGRRPGDWARWTGGRGAVNRQKAGPVYNAQPRPAVPKGRGPASGWSDQRGHAGPRRAETKRRPEVQCHGRGLGSVTSDQAARIYSRICLRVVALVQSIRLAPQGSRSIVTGDEPLGSSNACWAGRGLIINMYPVL
jgi:hypothetical protein